MIIGRVVGEGGKTEGSNTESNIEVAKPPVFNEEAEKVRRFIIAYRLHSRMRIRGATIEEQIQQILSYIQRESVDIQKESVLEDLKAEEVEFWLSGEFLLELKKEFEDRDKESVKVVELKRIEQGGKIMEEFVQEFKRAARESGYKQRPLANLHEILVGKISTMLF